MAPLGPMDPERFGLREARHLLLRAGFGGSPALVRQLVSWGLEQSVQRLLDMDASHGTRAPGPDDFASDIMLPLDEAGQMQLRNARRNQNEEAIAQFRLRRQQMQRIDRQQLKSMQQWWLTRMIETTRPLEEKMTLFWHGHFATSYRTTENSYHMFLQNQLFRAHAIGRFSDLLAGIVHDPAMLRYLNNHQNRKQNPNENLARELMELFSLGTGRYTERDIKEGARALTGYSFDGNAFTFNAQAHDSGHKQILGRSGPFDGDGFVRVILEQPACAAFISAKLYRFFVADLPDDPRAAQQSGAAAVIAQLARTMRANQYALAPVLRELFLSEHFYSPGVVAQRIKSPAELIVGAVRSMEMPAREVSVLTDAMDLMGQDLFFPPNVAGWPGERAWVNTSTLYTRQNVLAYLIAGIGPFAKPRDARLQFEADDFAERLQAADTDAALFDHLLVSTPSAAQRDAVRSAPTLNDKLLLIAAMPEYQLC